MQIRFAKKGTPPSGERHAPIQPEASPGLGPCRSCSMRRVRMSLAFETEATPFTMRVPESFEDDACGDVGVGRSR